MASYILVEEFGENIIIKEEIERVVVVGNYQEVVTSLVNSGHYIVAQSHGDHPKICVLLED